MITAAIRTIFAQPTALIADAECVELPLEVGTDRLLHDAHPARRETVLGDSPEDYFEFRTVGVEFHALAGGPRYESTFEVQIPQSRVMSGS